MLEGCKPASAAVLTCPSWLGADETYAGAVRVVVHLPGSGKEGRNVGGEEKIRCAVWPIQHTNLPLLRIARDHRLRERLWAHGHTVRGVPAEHVPHAQHPPGVAAEATENEG